MHSVCTLSMCAAPCPAYSPFSRRVLSTSPLSASPSIRRCSSRSPSRVPLLLLLLPAIPCNGPPASDEATSAIVLLNWNGRKSIWDKIPKCREMLERGYNTTVLHPVVLLWHCLCVQQQTFVIPVDVLTELALPARKPPGISLSFILAVAVFERERWISSR